jgi:hypothetical protein
VSWAAADCLEAIGDTLRGHQAELPTALLVLDTWQRKLAQWAPGGQVIDDWLSNPTAQKKWTSAAQVGLHHGQLVMCTPPSSVRVLPASQPPARP